MKRIAIQVLPVLGVIAAVWVAFNVIWLISLVPSPSMEPHIRTGTLCIANRLAYTENSPARQDVVYFSRPDTPYLLAKRVIGVGGDEITFTPDTVLVNEDPLNEPYLDRAFSYQPATFSVPEDHFFLMGDNRDHSIDSRDWPDPFVPANDIKARHMSGLYIPYIGRKFSACPVHHGHYRNVTYRTQ